MKCPQCDLALTFHRHDNTAVCHYCDYQVAAPNACPECQFAGMRFSGLGTQKLEAEVRARFPELFVPADGYRQHARPRQPRRGARRVSRWPGADSARHADDRQGARLSERHAGRRGQCGYGVALARFPRGGANVSTRDASGGPHRARAEGRPRAGANAFARDAGDRRGGAARLCRVRAARSCPTARRSAIRRLRR